MNTFQKSSIGAARRSGSRLMQGQTAFAAVLLAALMLLPPPALAAGQSGQAGQAPAAKAGASAAGDDGVPVRITVAGTKDEPHLVATIGEFPFDLDEAGKQFLKQEFFEHFFANTFGLEVSEVRSTLKIKLLPQTKETEREGEFDFDGINGRMHVAVAKRTVLVTCRFTEETRLNKGSLADFKLSLSTSPNS
jgi:hypothetical protein